MDFISEPIAINVVFASDYSSTTLLVVLRTIIQQISKNKPSHCAQSSKMDYCMSGAMYLNIDKAGMHTISFSMREDGFEFDKWVIERDYQFPIGFVEQRPNP